MTFQHLPTQIFKFCPRCGSGKFTPDSPKSLICEDCGFNYFFNMISAVAGLIYNHEDQLLMTYRAHDPAKGELDLPGGFVDLGEDAAMAMKREIMEELNLEVIQMDYYSSFPNEYMYGGLTYQTLDIIFTCRVATFETIKPADDVSGFVFIDPMKIPLERVGLSSIRNIIRGLQTNLQI